MSIDPANCTTEFVAAMRARLDVVGAGRNVEDPEVAANLAALATAVHAILTKPGRAETHADPTIDPDFWAWVDGLTKQVAELAAWQAGVRQAAEAWAPTDVQGKAFRTALLLAPMATEKATAPKKLTGHIQ
jgi:hypothetical protein